MSEYETFWSEWKKFLFLNHFSSSSLTCFQTIFDNKLNVFSRFFFYEDKWKKDWNEKFTSFRWIIFCTAGLRKLSLKERAHVITYQQLSVTGWLTDNGMCNAISQYFDMHS